MPCGEFWQINANDWWLPFRFDSNFDFFFSIFNNVLSIGLRYAWVWVSGHHSVRALLFYNRFSIFHWASNRTSRIRFRLQARFHSANESANSHFAFNVYGKHEGRSIFFFLFLLLFASFALGNCELRFWMLKTYWTACFMSRLIKKNLNRIRMVRNSKTKSETNDI